MPFGPVIRAAPVTERERWVSVAGRTTVETGGAHDLAARYWDLDDPSRAADLAMVPAADQVRVVNHPETVNRYAY